MKFSVLVKIVLSALLLTGCSNPHIVHNEKGPDMTVYSSDDEFFYYAIDENTEVVYLMFATTTSRGGITVAYNADGTIMKKSDLHLEND